MDVMLKAHELGKAIVESEEFKMLRSTEEAQQNDAEAMQILSNYNKVRGELIREVNEKEPTEERLNEIRNILNEEYEKLEENKTLNALLKAQTEFSNMIDKMNAIIGYYVQGPEENQGGCGGGSCSSCSSCS